MKQTMSENSLQKVAAENRRKPGRLVRTLAAVGLVSVIGADVTVHAFGEDRQASQTAFAEKTAFTRSEQINQELYTSKGFKEGVTAPAVLNGTITVKHPGFHPVKWHNPVVLAYAQPTSNPDAAGHFLDGSWIGLPSATADDKIALEPIQVHLGHGAGGDEVSVKLNDETQPVYSLPQLYVSPLHGHDTLNAYQADFMRPDVVVDVPITVSGTK